MNSTLNNEPAAGARPWWYQPEAALLTLLVLGIYFTRITALPIAGEEARWARGAVQILETGDWIVLRQQGQVFPERPPMSSWAMALVGQLRGEVDTLAVRLPSVLAVLCTSWVILAYARHFLSSFGAFAAAAIYATTGQVLEIGRMGESESLFTFFVSGSLLLWHLGYVKGWRHWLVWTLGYALAALAALVKGPQAPIYFGAAVGVFLAARREWRWIFSWQHALGIAVFALIVGAWQVPYYLATDWPSVVATWAGLASDRLTWSGLLSHIVTYPLETFACLLPWSPLLVCYAYPGFRRGLKGQTQLLAFLCTALLVTYPTLLFAAGARGRYFMPLYPCIAVLIGVVVQQCVDGVAARRDWQRFVIGAAICCAALGGVVLAASLWPGDTLEPLRQPGWFAACFALGTTAAALLLGWSCRGRDPLRSKVAFVTICVLCGVIWTGLVVNVQAAHWNDLRPTVAQLKTRLPEPLHLVSLGPVDHRFAYAYQTLIVELEWPDTADDLPADVEYFCFNRTIGDTAERRAAGRGRSWWTTAGTLPFSWEEVGAVSCDRRNKGPSDVSVVVGRVVRRPAVLASRPD